MILARSGTGLFLTPPRGAGVKNKERLPQSDAIPFHPIREGLNSVVSKEGVILQVGGKRTGRIALFDLYEHVRRELRITTTRQQAIAHGL